MSRTTAWVLHLAVTAMAVTGFWLTWVVFLAPEDPDAEFFTVNEYPAWVMAVHLIVGPILIFLIGFIWREHVWQRVRFRNAQRRNSGILLVILILPLALGGYVLQVTEAETARRIFGWLHAIAGSAFGVVYGIHIFLRPRREPALPAEP